jgi:hypothetical protein
LRLLLLLLAPRTTRRDARTAALPLAATGLR